MFFVCKKIFKSFISFLFNSKKYLISSIVKDHELHLVEVIKVVLNILLTTPLWEEAYDFKKLLKNANF